MDPPGAMEAMPKRKCRKLEAQNTDAIVNRALEDNFKGWPASLTDGKELGSAGTDESPDRCWFLVWCNGDCFKNQKDGRIPFADITAASGGRFASIKKVGKLGSMIDRYASGRPYVLVTDWRELKPCLEAIYRCKDYLPPLGLIVLEEDAFLLERAKVFLRKVDRKFPDLPNVLTTSSRQIAVDQARMMFTASRFFLGAHFAGGRGEARPCGASDPFSTPSTEDTKDWGSPAASLAASSAGSSGSRSTDHISELVLDKDADARHQRTVATLLAAAVGQLQGAELESWLHKHQPEQYDD